MSNRALRITRIKKLFGASLSKERIGIYLKIDGKIPELFTPIGQDEVCPDGTVIKNDPIRLLPRIDNGESYLVRIPEGEHIISVDNYSNHAEIKYHPLAMPYSVGMTKKAFTFLKGGPSRHGLNSVSY